MIKNLKNLLGLNLTLNFKMDARIFNSDEIAEINNYVDTQVPYSKLNKLFIISESPLEKISVFVAIFRILSAARDFSEGDETKKKLNKGLNEVKTIYQKVYKSLIDYEASNFEFEKDILRQDLVSFLKNPQENEQINSFISSFLVFAEKQELNKLNETTGVDFASPEGEAIHKKLSLGI